VGLSAVLLAALAGPARAEGSARHQRDSNRLPRAFSSEAVWNSATDDWEPTVAADPSSAYVYEMTTRYGGSKVCQTGCRTAFGSGRPPTVA
jgi:hypothetical protein